MRVFVVGTGRCGTTTFARACSHIENYTAAHESRADLLGLARIEYPDGHIECDNRLSWFLGPMAQRFEDEPSGVGGWRRRKTRKTTTASTPGTLWVHLTRDRQEVVRSFARREPKLGGIIPAFGNGITMTARQYSPEEISDVAGWYVDTVTANLDTFLRTRANVIRVDITRVSGRVFRDFWDQIGAVGDVDAALAEFSIRHNASD